MTIINKMLGRIFPRTIGVYYIILAMFLLLFFFYEMKQLYHRFQKEKRFVFYNTYSCLMIKKVSESNILSLNEWVNEINQFANQIELSQIKSSKQVKHLSEVLKLTFKKNNSDIERFEIMSGKKKLCLFDVDGTLTYPRKSITNEMKNFLLNEVGSKAELAIVGGSDFGKVSEQMGGTSVLSRISFTFSENGLVAHKYGIEFSRRDHLGEEALQKFINFALGYMSKLILPVKRGTFIEFRTGLINISPIGRGCNQTERDQFEEYDKIHKVREKFIEALKKEFPNLGLKYSIGGQISFDVFPVGWDKTYCLTHIKPDEYEEIHFFGDKTYEGGNDYEIFNSPLVIGHKVTSPPDTMMQLKTLLSLL